MESLKFEQAYRTGTIFC